MLKLYIFRSTSSLINFSKIYSLTGELELTNLKLENESYSNTFQYISIYQKKERICASTSSTTRSTILILVFHVVKRNLHHQTIQLFRISVGANNLSVNDSMLIKASFVFTKIENILHLSLVKKWNSVAFRQNL